MSFDNAISALSKDALRFVKDGLVIGLGSGRAATAFTQNLSMFVCEKNITVMAVPTSLQIKLVAEQGAKKVVGKKTIQGKKQGRIQLIEADQIDKIDVVFDGADQIDSEKNLIKGGGGALLRENILINAAKKVVIMADKTKFVKRFNRPVPVEVHPLARSTAMASINNLGGKPRIRTLQRGYPFITENGNIIFDCDFGVITKPRVLAQKIIQIPGVIEVGIFTRKPDIIYKAKTNGKYDIIT